MAKFYVQLEDKLLKISGELTAENISKALGYVPVSPNVTNELSQRVDNITFDSLKDNPFLSDDSGELNIVDEAGNIIAKVNAEGIHSVDFIAGEHRLSNKTDKAYVDGALKNAESDLTGYVNNIDFYNIKNNPIIDGEENSLTLVDENSNIGLKVTEDGLYVKDVIADGHTLSQKADRAELSNYATKDEVSDLVDMSVVIELQGKVNRLIDTDGDKSVRDIAVDVLTETLVYEDAADAYDTLEEVSTWIKSHPGDAAAMNLAIQKNTTDIQSNATVIINLDTAYKAADAEVLKDAQEYTNNINFYAIKDNPIVDNNDGNLTFVDASGNIGLQFSNNAILVNDVITPEHTLSNKADKAELPTKTSELTNDSGFITINDVPKVDIPTKVSAFENDKGYVTASEIPEIPSLEDYVKSENLPNFDDFAKTEDIPSLDGYAKTSDIPSLDGYAKTEDIPSLDGYATVQWVNSKQYATAEDLSNIDYSSINNVPVLEDETGELNITDNEGNIGMKVASEAVYAKDFVAGGHKLSEKVDKTYVDYSIAELVDGAPETLDTLNELAAALKDNADIVDVLNQSIGSKQDAITDLETIRQGAAKGATALQEEQYRGTVIGVTINGTTKNPSNGIVDLGTVITDISGKQDKLVSGANIVTINNNSILGGGNFDLATSDQLRSFQPNLVSGQNIKTINGESILGEGNINISGSGSSDANVQAVDTGTVVDEVNIEYYATKTYVNGLIENIERGSKEIVEVTVNTGSIAFTGMGDRPSFEPNKIYYATIPIIESVYIVSVIPPTEDIGEYSLHFTTTEEEHAAGIIFETPSSWLWANGEIPSLELETNTHYELSVVATKFGTDYVYKAVLTPFKSV